MTTDTQSPIHIVATDDTATLRLIELAAAKAIIRDLQLALSTWSPLLAAYEREMAGRAACRFAVEPLDIWVRDLARTLNGGRCVEDAGAVSDWLSRDYPEGE